jgi:hypothetical protein
MFSATDLMIPRAGFPMLFVLDWTFTYKIGVS